MGINPVRGGIPANDNIDTINIILFIKLFLNVLYILLIDFELEEFITINTGITIIEYIIKYIIQEEVLLIPSIEIIHPIWPIDEYASRARRWVWLIPRIPPIKAFIAATVINIALEFDLYETDINSDKGANFCQVDRIRQFIHDRDNITEGYQKWHGAAPSLINIERMIIIFDISCIINWFISLILSNIIIDPIAWERKYLMEASVSWLYFDFIMIGINLNMFNSNIIHAIIQFGLSMVITDLSISIQYIVYIKGDWFSIKDLEELNPLLMVRSL